MRTRTAQNLKQELKSDSFSGTARKMLDNNLKTIIETAVSKNHQDLDQSNTVLKIQRK